MKKSERGEVGGREVGRGWDLDEDGVSRKSSVASRKKRQRVVRSKEEEKDEKGLVWCLRACVRWGGGPPFRVGQIDRLGRSDA